MKNAGSQGVENMGSPFLTNKHLPAFRFATKRSASNFFFFFGECPPTETRLITLPQTLVHQPGLSTNTIQNITTLIAQSINQSINFIRECELIKRGNPFELLTIMLIMCCDKESHNSGTDHNFLEGV